MLEQKSTIAVKLLLNQDIRQRGNRASWITVSLCLLILHFARVLQVLYGALPNSELSPFYREPYGSCKGLNFQLSPVAARFYASTGARSSKSPSAIRRCQNSGGTGRDRLSTFVST